MERLNQVALVLLICSGFLLGCATDQERPTSPEPKLSAIERASVDFLKGKGARLTWWDPKVNQKNESVEPCWFAHLDGDGRAAYSSADLSHLKQLKGLKYLSIQSPNLLNEGLITDEGLAVIAELNKIVDLTIGGSLISDRGIDKLADILTLEKLTLNRTKLTGEAFKRFGKLHKLKHIKFEQTIPDDGLSGLKTLNGLKELDLSETNVTDGDLKTLMALERLERLNLTKTRISDAGMAALSNLPSLKWLVLNESAVGNEGLKHLSRSRTLAGLILGKTKVDDDGLAHIPDFKNLTILELGQEPISDKGLSQLRNSKLTDLTLEFNVNQRVTNRGIESLKEIKTLKRIQNIAIEFTKATDEGLRRLQDARPDLEIRTLKH
jgi:hypothetical protein